jgi:hypothetical protein
MTDIANMQQSWEFWSDHVGVACTADELATLATEIRSGRARVSFDSGEWAQPVPEVARYWLVRATDSARLVSIRGDRVEYDTLVA